MTFFASQVRKELETAKQTIKTLTDQLNAAIADNTKLKGSTVEVVPVVEAPKETPAPEAVTSKDIVAASVEAVIEPKKDNEFQVKMDELNTKLSAITKEKESLTVALNTKQEIDQKAIDEMVNKQLAVKLATKGLVEGTLPPAPIQKDKQIKSNWRVV